MKLVVLAVLPVLLLSGCRSPASQESGQGILPAPVGKPGSPVSLSVTPSPNRSLVPSTFTVTRHPVLPEHAIVTIILTMPSMAMPETVIQAHTAGKGVYQGTGAFSMPGEWQAETRVVAGSRRLTGVSRILVK